MVRGLMSHHLLVAPEGRQEERVVTLYERQYRSVIPVANLGRITHVGDDQGIGWITLNAVACILGELPRWLRANCCISPNTSQRLDRICGLRVCVGFRHPPVGHPRKPTGTTLHRLSIFQQSKHLSPPRTTPPPSKHPARHPQCLHPACIFIHSPLNPLAVILTGCCDPRLAATLFTPPTLYRSVGGTCV